MLDLRHLALPLPPLPPPAILTDEDYEGGDGDDGDDGDDDDDNDNADDGNDDDNDEGNESSEGGRIWKYPSFGNYYRPDADEFVALARSSSTWRVNPLWHVRRLVIVTALSSAMDCPALIDSLRALSNIGARLHHLELKGVFVTSDLLDALKPLVDERTVSLSMDTSVNVAPSLTDLFASLFSGNLSRVKLDGFMKTDLASAIVAANAAHLKVFRFVCADGEGAGLPCFDKVGNLESLTLDYRDAEYPSFLSSIFFGHSELLVNLVLTLDLTGSAADFPLDAILAAAPNLRAFNLDDLGIDDVVHRPVPPRCPPLELLHVFTHENMGIRLVSDCVRSVRSLSWKNTIAALKTAVELVGEASLSSLTYLDLFLGASATDLADMSTLCPRLEILTLSQRGPLDNAFKEPITLLAQRLRLLTIYPYSAKDVEITLKCATELQLCPGKLKRLVFVFWWYDRLDAATKERLRQIGRNSQGLVEFVGYYQGSPWPRSSLATTS
ncbi:hypothetical protein HK405_006437 [Cladochytrium tenue]|nr:hypothetical protein HK405_006437 [Cladochytrium tenue]